MLKAQFDHKQRLVFLPDKASTSMNALLRVAAKKGIPVIQKSAPSRGAGVMLREGGKASREATRATDERQPERQVWSDEFFIGIVSSGKVELAGRLLAGNLPEPQGVTLTIDADVNVRDMTVAELISLPDLVNGED